MAGQQLWAWDDTNKKFIPVQVDTEGRLKTVAEMDKLDDIGDVNVPTPADDELLYWDETEGKWQARALEDGDIPAAIARDAEVASAITDHAADKSARQSNLIGITFIIDGGGAAITTGQKGHLLIPFACTIEYVYLMADQVGSIEIDIWKDAMANFPPTVGDSITSETPPTITAAQEGYDDTLAGWTVAIAAGDVLAFNVVSCATIQRVTLCLRAAKT